MGVQNSEQKCKTILSDFEFWKSLLFTYDECPSGHLLPEQARLVNVKDCLGAITSFLKHLF